MTPSVSRTGGRRTVLLSVACLFVLLGLLGAVHFWRRVRGAAGTVSSLTELPAFSEELGELQTTGPARFRYRDLGRGDQVAVFGRTRFQDVRAFADRHRLEQKLYSTGRARFASSVVEEIGLPPEDSSAEWTDGDLELMGQVSRGAVVILLYDHETGRFYLTAQRTGGE